MITAPSWPTLWAAVATVALFTTIWLICVRIRDVSIVDTFWGPAFGLVALVAVLSAGTGGVVRWLLVAMTAGWALRLGGFLFARFRRHDSEDPRYAAIRKRHSEHFNLYSLGVIFSTQALLVMIVSLPLQIAARHSQGFSWVVIPGVIVWAAGLAIEAIGDEQQRRFSARRSSEDEVNDSGLWRYSRHPNKFGDLLAWWGLWLVAITAGGTWWTVIGPLAMSAVLVRGTGRGEDAEGDSPKAIYTRRTSGFIPLPPH